MTDLAGLGVQLERPGLQDLVVRGYHDVWLWFEDGSLVRGPALAVSNTDLPNLLARLTGQQPLHEGDRPDGEVN